LATIDTQGQKSGIHRRRHTDQSVTDQNGREELLGITAEMEGQLRSSIPSLGQRLQLCCIDRKEADFGRGYHSRKNNKAQKD